MNYAPTARLEDRLGPHEPPYRSRGEAQVGRLLDRYGIPFFYEQPTLIYDRGRHRIWHPDFTLPTYDGLIIEYAGMPDRPAYMDGVRHKQAAYRANAIPALFLLPRDLRGRSWPRHVMQQIDCVPLSTRDYPTGLCCGRRILAGYHSTRTYKENGYRVMESAMRDETQ